MITKTYDEFENILHIVRRDRVYREDVIDLLHDITESMKGHSQLCIVDDLRDSCSMFSTMDYPYFAREINKCIAHFGHVRHAFLVEKPKNTALGLFFQQYIAPKIENYVIKTFSTPKAACLWLKG